VVFLQGAKVGDSGRLWRLPALAIVDAPGVHHDHRGLAGPQPIGNLDDSAGVVGKPPGSHREVCAFVADQERRFISPQLAHWLDKLRKISQQRWRIF
jgi:hypothetical protein